MIYALNDTNVNNLQRAIVGETCHYVGNALSMINNIYPLGLPLRNMDMNSTCMNAFGIACGMKQVLDQGDSP